MAHMKVRYNPVIAVLAIVLGGICLFLGLWLTMLGEFSPALIAGPVPVVLGILYLARPYFHVTPRSVEVSALIGSMVREYPYESLQVERGKLVAVGSDGSHTKIPVSAGLAHPGDWRAVTGRR